MENPNPMSLTGALHSSDSPFIDTAAVDAWDAWFRWRDCGVLRDLTIDATWDRVATALTSVEPAVTSTMWKHRFTDAFSNWRLLLDERILATAGTKTPNWNSSDKLIAVLNVAAFIRAPSSLHAAFDQVNFESTAALAVRALDNATLLVGNKTALNVDFQIGIVGFANALTMLDLPYGGIEASTQATLIASLLAHGCLRGSLQLACERGANMPCTPQWRVKINTLDEELIDDAQGGIRHSRLTAITSQRKLALLANNVTDALDPLTNTVRCTQHAPLIVRTHNPICVVEQLKLRAAMQKWIDQPIAYPLSVNSEPSEQDLVQLNLLGTSLGLPKTGWRRSDQRPEVLMRHSATSRSGDE